STHKQTHLRRKAPSGAFLLYARRLFSTAYFRQPSLVIAFNSHDEAMRYGLSVHPLCNQFALLALQEIVGDRHIEPYFL
ncbi:MAG: hypothetical protein Q4D92_06845, partial [Slackia sp.]|nr:hypothetical protein [Slackia sp.]